MLIENSRKDRIALHIEKLEEEVRVLDAKLEGIKKELKLLKEFQGGGVFLGDHIKGSSFKGMKLTRIIVEILKDQSRPITRQSLRDFLINEAGISVERLGKGNAYFYVVLNRLEKNGTIHREGDEISIDERGKGHLASSR